MPSSPISDSISTNIDKHDKESILIVEDEQIVALDMGARLERMGYDVPEPFSSAEDALAFLESGTAQIDCVLMDINLQGDMDGVSAANIVREKWNIPVIIITAYADETTVQRAKASEPFAYIIKPFNDRELRTSIVISLYRHAMERRLQVRERLLSGILGSIDSGVIVSSGNGTVAFANRLAGEIIDASISPGVPLARSIPVEILIKARSEPSTRWTLDRLGGGAKTIEISAHHLQGLDAGAVDEFVNGEVWVLNDITQRLADEKALRRKDEQLALAEKMDAVGRISGGLAHDFNNLVTIMMGYARLALDDIARGRTVDEIGKKVEGVHETARRSAALTRQLLAFSRIEVSSSAVVELDEEVRGGTTLVKGIVPENISIEYILHAPDTFVRVDPGRLEQIVVNLILNARDAMPDGGSIRLSTEIARFEAPIDLYVRRLEPGTYLRLDIGDSGDGIDPVLLPYIFEPFYSTKERYRGSGFGLATVYASVEDAGGAISIHSTIGQGTTFSVFFPVVDGESNTPVVDRAVDERVSGTEAVLVVQEEAGVRRLISRVLQDHGYRTTAARSVGDGLLLIEKVPGFAAVVTDRSAPYLTVAEIVARFRTSSQNALAVIYTAVGEIDSAGQDATLIKPFETPELLTTVRAAIDRCLNSRMTL